MKVHTLVTEQILPVEKEVIWDFISSPANLATITPDEMDFKVTSGFEENEKMYPGMIITYKVKPMPGFAVDWMTEITHVKEQEFFVDEQRFGPYRFWHHKHFIEETDRGVKMTDVVHYMLPFGLLGNIANAVWVRERLKFIFQYRYDKLEEIFGKSSVQLDENSAPVLLNSI